MQWVAMFQMAHDGRVIDLHPPKADAGYGGGGKGSSSAAALMLGVGSWQVVEPHRYLVKLSGSTVDLPKSSRKLASGLPAKYAIKISLVEAERERCIQDKAALDRIPGARR